MSRSISGAIVEGMRGLLSDGYQNRGIHLVSSSASISNPVLKDLLFSLDNALDLTYQRAVIGPTGIK